MRPAPAPAPPHVPRPTKDEESKRANIEAADLFEALEAAQRNEKRTGAVTAALSAQNGPSTGEARPQLEFEAMYRAALVRDDIRSPEQALRSFSGNVAQQLPLSPRPPAEGGTVCEAARSAIDGVYGSAEAARYEAFLAQRANSTQLWSRRKRRTRTKPDDSVQESELLRPDRHRSR